MKQLLKKVIADQQQNLLWNPKNIVRALPDKMVKSPEILVVSGVRRCGKSTLLQQIRATLPEQNFYLNFDDERLVGFSVNDFQTLHEVFIELFGEQKTFYFDEIQNIPEWERFIRRLYDYGYKVFVTGSNAAMLSRELGTRLTGRYLRWELFPFSFNEFLAFKGKKITAGDLLSTSGKASIVRQFNDYFKQGGFPLYLSDGNGDYLKSLFENIIYRDVMVRNNIRNEQEILTLTRYLAGTVAQPSTNNSLSKIINVKHATTVRKYISCLENSYLIYQISKYDVSFKKQLHNPKRTYFIDNALARKFGFNFSDNNGQMLENLVLIELKRRGKEVYYHQDKQECDFVLKEGNHICEAIQVCYSFGSGKTKEREITGLSEAMVQYNLSKGLILTYDVEETVRINRKTIAIMPVWKWLMQ
jgi:predicted AAA+ superfamily ATPase